jgi:hypothetical protein
MCTDALLLFRAASVLGRSCSFALLAVGIAVADTDACTTAHFFCCSNHHQRLPFPSMRMLARRLEASTNGAVAEAEVPHCRYRLEAELQMMATDLGIGCKSISRIQFFPGGCGARPN